MRARCTVSASAGDTRIRGLQRLSNARMEISTLLRIHDKAMKIIDNKKDYYDYLAGILGVDDLVVYDRRGSVALGSESNIPYDVQYYFSQKILTLDKLLEDKRYWHLKSIIKQRELETSKHSYIMNQIYLTADLHFGHSNILKHSPNRPFSDTVDIVAQGRTRGRDVPLSNANIEQETLRDVDAAWSQPRQVR